jgi:hypothetical protein
MRCLLLTLLVLAGCSTIPSTEIYYYPTQAITKVTITHALSCSEDKSKFSLISTGNTATTSSADTSEQYTLYTSNYGNSTGSAALTPSFTDDRLAGFNTSSTGAGGQIIKTILSLAGPVATAQSAGPDISSFCAKVAQYGDKNTIAYNEVATIKSPVLYVE